MDEKHLESRNLELYGKAEYVHHYRHAFSHIPATRNSRMHKFRSLCRGSSFVRQQFFNSCRFGNLKAMAFLWKFRFLLDNRTLENAMVSAIHHDNVSIIRYMLDNGLDINGISLDFFVIIKNKTMWYRILDEYGFDFSKGQSFVAQCIYDNDMEALKFLETHGLSCDNDRCLDHMRNIAWQREYSQMFMHMFDSMDAEQRMEVLEFLNPTEYLQMGIDSYNHVNELRTKIMASLSAVQI